MYELKASLYSANEFYSIHEVEEEQYSESWRGPPSGLPEIDDVLQGTFEYESPLTSAAHSRNGSRDFGEHAGSTGSLFTSPSAAVDTIVSATPIGSASIVQKEDQSKTPQRNKGTP